MRVRRGDAVATVSLARPDARNALNAGLIGELARCMEELTEDGNVRVVVLTGEGDFFCAGADIGYMRDTANFSYEENLEDAHRLAAMFGAVDGCPKPVVARIKGAAIGGGVGLVAAADVAVAEEGTVFAFPEVRLGISPATIAPFVVRKIGHSQVRALFLTGERFDAVRAREIGLVHEVASGRTSTRRCRRWSKGSSRAAPRLWLRRRPFCGTLGMRRLAKLRRSRPGASRSSARGRRVRRAWGPFWRNASPLGGRNYEL